MYNAESHSRIAIAARYSPVVLLLLMLSSANLAAPPEAEVVVYRGDGLWVMRQPWPETEAWCRNGGANPAKKVYDIYAYYDAPHERRMDRLGGSYDTFVKEKVIAGIRQLCGSSTTITDLVVALYRKSDATDPDELVDDLSNSRTQPWDFISFKVDGASVVPVKYEAKEAAYHLTSAELRALDPRSEAVVQQAMATTQVSDYTLYEGDGFTMTSSFDRPGRAWCEHVYVTIVVGYEGSDDALDRSFGDGYESFLQAKIVPAIQDVCPQFPDTAGTFPQTIRLEFKPAAAARMTSFMGFSVAGNGTVAWREGRQTKRQLALAEEQRRIQQAEEQRRVAREAALRAERSKQASAPRAAYEFLEVECSETITGFMHTNTVVPYVKMVSTLSAEESRQRSAEMADCFDALTTVLQVSNPYADSVRFDVFDNSGQSFVQNDVPLTPKSTMEPLHEPERLRLLAGSWETTWYQADLRWDWRESEFTAVISDVTAKGAEVGFKAGDVVMSARISPTVLADETVLALPATLTLAPAPDPLVFEGALAIQSKRGDVMMFSEGKETESVVVNFTRVNSP